MNKNLKNICIFLVPWLFFFLRYFLDEPLASLHEFANYFVEVVFVFVMAIVLKSQFNFKFYASKKSALIGALSLVSGYGIYKAAIYGGILIPFELDAALTIFLLLIVAPVLEELLFRFVFINANAKLIKNHFVLVLLSALAFSLAHLNALRYVPELVKGFVIYQGIYTFILGVVCALVYVKSGKKILSSVAVHFLFNVGFFLASQP